MSWKSFLREPYTPRLSGCPLDINLVLPVIAKTRGGQLLIITIIVIAVVISMIWHSCVL